MMPESDGRTTAKIKVVGVGGGGGNAVNRMKQEGIKDVEYIALNTDLQALSRVNADKKLQIGAKSTKGLGAGGHPDVGQKAAEESSADIIELLTGADMVFITTGMGGGTGTGAAPVVAQIARDQGALTVAVVTKPFEYEGLVRADNAAEGIANLKDKVDTLIVLPNERLLLVGPEKTPIGQAFGKIDEVLMQGIQGVVGVITNNGLINRDFHDVKTIMSNAGSALMSIGRASGDNRANDAAEAAISNPLQEETIDGAKGLLMVFAGGPDMTVQEINLAARLIKDMADEHVNVITGIVVDESFGADFQVTLIATGFDGASSQMVKPQPKNSAHGSAMPATESARSNTADGQYDPVVRHQPSRAPRRPVPDENVPPFLLDPNRLRRRRQEA